MSQMHSHKLTGVRQTFTVGQDDKYTLFSEISVVATATVGHIQHRFDTPDVQVVEQSSGQPAVISLMPYGATAEIVLTPPLQEGQRRKLCYKAALRYSDPQTTFEYSNKAKLPFLGITVGFAGIAVPTAAWYSYRVGKGSEQRLYLDLVSTPISDIHTYASVHVVNLDPGDYGIGWAYK